MAKFIEPHAECAVRIWVMFVSMERFSVGHQSAGNPTSPFFVANATSQGRVEVCVWRATWRYGAHSKRC